MEYAAMTFWLFVIVLSALGVHHIWSSLVQPKVVNSVLLPGTLVAQIGHIIALLITGGTIDNTSLIKDDDSGEPQTGKDPKSKLPVVGSIVIALFPLAACAVGIYAVAHYLGLATIERFQPLAINQDPQQFLLPTSINAFFAMLAATIGRVSELVNIIRESDSQNWRTWLFYYLVVCMTVRMAPLTGNLRGSLGAILLAGLFAFLLGQIAQSTAESLRTLWPLITFTVASLLLLLIISLLVKGIVALVRAVSG